MRLAALALLWLSLFAGTLPLGWTWPTTNVDGSQLTDLDHGRMVLYRCRQDSIVRRQPPFVHTFVSTVDSIVLPNIAAAGREGQRDSINVSLLDGHHYYIHLQGVDHSGNRSPVASWLHAMPAVETPEPPPPDTSGTGILGKYYSGQSRNQWIADRRDTTIDMAWGDGSPMAGVPEDYWSVEWIGKIVIATAGVYTFYVEAQSGAQLYVNGGLYIDRLGDYPLTEWSAAVSLPVGEHGIVLIYTARVGNAECHLMWSGPGISKRIVPREVLR